MNPFSIYHPALGTVTVRPDRRCRRITARWKKGAVNLTVPSGLPQAQLTQALDSMAGKLLDIKPILKYSEGQRIFCPGVEFTISRQRLKPASVIAKPAIPVTHIGVGTELSLDDDHTTATISKVMCRAAEALAPALLLPMAKAVAQEVGAAPEGWMIGRGHKVLGTCSSKKIITLSRILVFMPAELQRYIVCHELAHLSHMNHSAEFHRLCNRYCHGRERELYAAMRSFKFPVIR